MKNYALFVIFEKKKTTTQFDCVVGGALRVKDYQGYLARRKAKIRNQYNQVTHTTQGSNKNTGTHNMSERQEVSPFPAGDHRAAKNRQDSTR